MVLTGNKVYKIRVNKKIKKVCGRVKLEVLTVSVKGVMVGIIGGKLY